MEHSTSLLPSAIHNDSDNELDAMGVFIAGTVRADNAGWAVECTLPQMGTDIQDDGGSGLCIYINDEDVLGTSYSNSTFTMHWRRILQTVR